MSVSSVAQSQVHALLTSTPAEQVDWVDDRYASLRSEPEWDTIWGGCSDSMHLTGHVEAPLGPTARETFPTTPELDSHGLPRASLIAPSYVGWYTALRLFPGPTRIGPHDLLVDVCRRRVNTDPLAPSEV